MSIKTKDYFEESSRLFDNNVLLSKGEKEGKEYYKYSTTGANVCKKCLELDGKVFKILEAKAGLNLPPLHPNCKCEVEVVEDSDKLSSLGEKPLKEKIPSTAKPTANMEFGDCAFGCKCGAHGIRADGSIIPHSGVDLLPETRGNNDPVYAVISGTVKNISGDNNGTAISITSFDGATVTTYLHLDEIHVEDGDTVNAGTQIGTMGDTGLSEGVHLHFGVSYNGGLQNPRDFFNW
jgi:hypothetical protein